MLVDKAGSTPFSSSRHICLARHRGKISSSPALFLPRKYLAQYLMYHDVNAHSPFRDGKKMSKSLKNYPDPNAVIDQYGADATRYVW